MDQLHLALLFHFPSLISRSYPQTMMLKNLSMHSVESEEDALNMLFLGDTNRAIAATEMNQNSTRSHCIFTVVLEKRSADADTVVRSKLNIVDLAGSERVARTNSAGQTLREAKYINSSLFFLEMVIVALYEKEKRKVSHHGKLRLSPDFFPLPNIRSSSLFRHYKVPYRNSMMTSVLRDSLGGNCKTIMIATISPESQHTGESISTCQFAQRVALVKNSASVNEEVEPEQVIKRLRAEVKRLREEVAFLSGKNDDDDSSREGDADAHFNLAPEEIKELTVAVERYVQDRHDHSHLDFCGGIALPKIRAVCSIFKEMLLRKSKERTIDDDSVDVCDEGSLQEDKRSSPQQHAKLRQSGGNTCIAHQQQRRSQSDSVCGVPRCRDKNVLDDPEAAFRWYKERYPGLAAIDEAKKSLKEKYNEVLSSPLVSENHTIHPVTNVCRPLQFSR